MQHVLAPSGLPTPPASPLSFDHPKCMPAQQQHVYQQSGPAIVHRHQPHYVPVAPEDRIGTFLGSLQLTGIIGTGAYGVVYEAVDIKTNARYAVKALSKLNPDGTPLDARQNEYQTREIRLHYMASAHPNVVSMLKIVDAYPDCLFVVLEYCPEGDLFYNITECGHFVGKDELARKVFLQILDAVQYLHQAGIYHRDLKPENILVADQGETLKLADFGLATASDRSEDYGCGSTFYMSPECLGQTNSKRPYYYCAPNDVWSLGVILVNLTCGRNPWKQASPEDSTYRAYMRNRGFLKTILPLTDELDDILARIFNPIPEQRISLAELRQRILACPRFTVSQQQQQPVIHQQPEQPVIAVTPAQASTYSGYAAYEDEDAIVDDDDFGPISPVSSNQSSLESSSTSTSSSCSSVDPLVDDDGSDVFLCENATPPPIVAHPPPVQCDLLSVYESEDAHMVGMDSPFQAQQQIQQQIQPPIPPQIQSQPPGYHFTNVPMPPNYVPFIPGPVQQPLSMTPVSPMQQLLPQQHVSMPLPHAPPPQHLQQQALRQTPPCGGISKFFLWDWMVGKNAQPVQPFNPAHHHLSILPLQHTMFMQGCY